jgi:hypothetical protein
MLGLALASFSIISETLELHSSIACGLKCFDKDPFGIGNKNLSFLKIDMFPDHHKVKISVRTFQ